VIAALVPAKALDQAKGRLAAILNENERRGLALAMLEDVLRALRSAEVIESVSVVSPDESVLQFARALGAEALEEPPSVRGINQALSHGLNAIADCHPDGVLVVLADVPGIRPSDVTAIIEALPREGVVICPSADKGTSALALRPIDVIPFRFGENSFQAHKREAAARGLPLRVLRIASLANDIDEPDDLRELLSHPTETATHRLLAQLDIVGRLAGTRT